MPVAASLDATMSGSVAGGDDVGAAGAWEGSAASAPASAGVDAPAGREHPETPGRQNPAPADGALVDDLEAALAALASRRCAADPAAARRDASGGGGAAAPESGGRSAAARMTPARTNPSATPGAGKEEAAGETVALAAGCGTAATRNIAGVGTGPDRRSCAAAALSDGEEDGKWGCIAEWDP